MYWIWAVVKVVIFLNLKVLELIITLEQVNSAIRIDVAEVSIDQARERYRNIRGHKFQANFFVADSFGVIPLLII